MRHEDKASAKRYVGIWKETGKELDRIKWEELRSMSEEEAQTQAAAVLALADEWIGREAFTERECGMVEQQQIFQRTKR
ncbi:MAG: hypothetical protein ACFCU3_11220 [Verrucomicrobiales bacterium]